MRLAAVVRLYLNSVIQLERPRDGKGWAKTIGLGLLTLLVSAEAVGVFLVSDVVTYQALRPVGLQSLVLSNAVVSASALTFVFGVLTLLSLYFLPAGEAPLLAMPLRPVELLAGKFVLTYVLNLPAALAVLGPALGVWAFFEQPGPGFYLAGLVLLFALPLLPLALTYALLVTLIRLGRPLRNKTVLQYGAATLGVALALALNITIQAAARQGFSGSAQPLPGSFVAQWCVAALTGTGWAALSATALVVVVGAAAAAAAVVGLARPYRDSLPTFLETRIHRTKDVAGFVRTTFHRTTLVWALFRREVVLMNREPSFFFNGPFVLVLMPVLLAVALVVQKADLVPALAQVSLDPAVGPWLVWGTAGAGVFLASTTLIGATAFSREGRTIAFLKSLPLPPRHLAVAKLSHAAVFNLLACLIASVAGAALLGIGWSGAALALVTAFPVACLLSLLSLLVDTAAPRLSWDNPLRALKSNPNAVIGLFGSWGVVALLAWGLTAVPVSLRPAVPLVVGLGGLAALWPAYVRFLDRAWNRWEV